MKPNHSFRKIVASLIVLLSLSVFVLTIISCGGGDNTQASGGIGGTGVTVGMASDYGSIIVNDMEFDTRNADVFVEGQYSGSFEVNDVTRTITLNVSTGGCFVITDQTLESGSNIAFIFKELATRTPIIGEVRWVVTWGRKMTMPGMGIKFEDIEDLQHQELTEKYGLE